MQASRREYVVPYLYRSDTELFGYLKLAFDKLLYEFHASQHSSRIEEALEPEHRTDPSLDAPVVLFDDVVKIRASADLDGAFPPVIEFVIHTHAAQGGMGWFEAVEGNHTRIAVTAKRSTEEGFGGGDVARSTEVGFDGFTLFIHSAVEVHPLTAYLEVGLVYAPGIADRPLVGSPTFFEFGDVAYDPAQDCARGDVDAEFSDQFCQVPVTQFETQIPAHTGDNNVVGEPTLQKEWMTG